MVCPSRASSPPGPADAARFRPRRAPLAVAGPHNIETRTTDAASRPSDRLVDQPVELVAELELAGGVDLGHHDPDHLVPGVDPEVGVIDPAPTEGARRVLLAVGAGQRGHAEAVAEGEPVHGNPERQALSLVTGHQVDRLGP